MINDVKMIIWFIMVGGSILGRICQRVVAGYGKEGFIILSRLTRSFSFAFMPHLQNPNKLLSPLWGCQEVQDRCSKKIQVVWINNFHSRRCLHPWRKACCSCCWWVAPILPETDEYWTKAYLKMGWVFPQWRYLR